jgi:quinone-modifying oxidoreductase subunit QmoC
MSFRMDPGLHREVAKYGGEDVAACMNCGNCTAVCSLSTESESFPRRIVHLLQIGHTEKLLGSPDPWLCYYCGDCSDTCPRQADPGETMMAARRYLTASYDWTGMARRFYTSAAWQVGVLTAVGLLVVALFALFHGPVVRTRVALNTFAPVEWVEFGDWILGGTVGLLLLSNAWKMCRRVLGFEKVPVSLLLGEAWTFGVHLATQKRWRDCDGQRLRWVRHLLLASGYVTMGLLIEVGLRWFQTDQVYPLWHPVRLLGYYAAAVLLYGSAAFFLERLRKREPIHRSSQASDWIFLGLLFLVAFTGLLVHIFRLMGLPLATYVTYVVHLAFAAQWIVQVPFSKWSHILYRPLAMYLTAVLAKARELAGQEEERPPAPQPIAAVTPGLKNG